VGGAADWGHKAAPPVELEGDTVYVGNANEIQAVDWHTGEPRSVEHVTNLVMSGGRTIASPTLGTFEVSDVATGDVLLTVEGIESAYPVLSPDGSHVILGDLDVPDEFDVYDIDSGQHVTIDGEFSDFGWTASSDLYGVSTRGVQSCDVDTGTCTTDPLPGGPDLLPDDPDVGSLPLLGGWWQ
jgi:hypothetical protein